MPENLVPVPGPGTPVPGTPRGFPPSNPPDTRSRSPVPGRSLPGGQRLPREDVGGNKFVKRAEVPIPVEAPEDTDEASSEDSELIPDADGPGVWKKLIGKLRESEICLSKKLMEKGKGVKTRRRTLMVPRLRKCRT